MLLRIKKQYLQKLMQKLYVLVVTLSTDNGKLLPQLKSAFKHTVN